MPAIAFVSLLGRFLRIVGPSTGHSSTQKLQKRFVRHESYIKLGNAFRRSLVLPHHGMYKGSRSKVVQ